MEVRDKDPKKITIQLVRDLYFGTSTLDNIIPQLQKVWDDNHSTHENIHIEVDIEDSYDMYHATCHMSIVGERLENRSELLDRVKKEEKRETVQEVKMRQDYENLKRYFGDGS